MATKLTKDVSRETTAKIFERSAHRTVIVTLAPPCMVRFRLKGTKRTYTMDAATLYHLAVRATQ